MSRPEPKRLWLAGALLLPLIVLGSTWATTYRSAQQGQDWLIPIEGYDPRDLLRGHFVQYRYAWPTGVPREIGPDGSQTGFNPAYASSLCIEGVAPNVRRVREVTIPDTATGPLSVSGCAIVVRATLGTRREVRGLDSGIFYASQARALALSRQLADPKLQGMVLVRIRPDGVMRPIDLKFRPRPAAPPSPAVARPVVAGQ